ncbi:MAG: hypothetical protein QJR00_05255 [Bacillota bacterium]|nr:hypothetical protein [Bacillota bacterium]
MRLKAYGTRAIALLLSFVYGYSAWTKLADPATFKISLEGYSFLRPWASFLLWSVPILEVTLAAFLILSVIWDWRRGLRGSLLVAAAGFAAFTLVLSWSLWTGEGQAGCGCFGGLEPVSPWDVVRDGSFLLAALVGFYLAAPAEGPLDH